VSGSSAESSPATSSPRRHRGQAGVTLIEVMIVVGLSSLVLLPVLAVMFMTVRTRTPVTTMNDQASQLRLFRSNLARDWASAKTISTAPTWPYVECNGPGASGTIVLVLVTFDWNTNALKRVLYKTRPNPDPKYPGTVDLIRRECFHAETNGFFDYGTRTNDPGGSDTIVVERVKTLSVPAACNPTGAPPFVPCDMNISLTTSDGQVATLRLHQETGRTS